MNDIRPGQQVKTPKGQGQVLHPEKPGHPGKAWVVVINKIGYVFTRKEIQDYMETEE